MKPVYCHFSFRRPKGKDYGIFATALYADEEGKRLVCRKTRVYKLWENQQFVTAIQSYEHALNCLFEWQGKLLEYDVTNILLVTDNSILATWIEEPGHNKRYKKYMAQAVAQYRVGCAREIMIPVGLCEPRKSEKSHKFCREELVSNMETLSQVEGGTTKIRFNEGTQIRNILDILSADETKGVDELVEME